MHSVNRRSLQNSSPSPENLEFLNTLELYILVNNRGGVSYVVKICFRSGHQNANHLFTYYFHEFSFKY